MLEALRLLLRLEERTGLKVTLEVDDIGCLVVHTSNLKTRFVSDTSFTRELIEQSRFGDEGLIEIVACRAGAPCR